MPQKKKSRSEEDSIDGTRMSERRTAGVKGVRKRGIRGEEMKITGTYTQPLNLQKREKRKKLPRNHGGKNDLWQGEKRGMLV